MVTQKRTLVYDPTTQRLSSATNPESGTVSYIYNTDGTFTYDTCPTGDNFCTSAAGHLVEAVFATSVGSDQLSLQYDYTYNPAGKVAGKTLTVQSMAHKSVQQVPANGSLTASYTYDNQGALATAKYPLSETWTKGATQSVFNYTVDSLERVTGYSPNKNNGQIRSSTDGVKGETVAYQYDALKRLIGAQGLNGYGNLLQMTGTAGAPNMNLTAALDSNGVPNNRINATGANYDNNGNQTAGFGGVSLTYDAANRVSVAALSQSSTYAYDSGNQRVYSSTNGAATIYLYGADGKKLAAYTYTIITYNGNPEVQLVEQTQNVYFAGRLISARK